MEEGTDDFAAHMAQSIDAKASWLYLPKLGSTESGVPYEIPSVVERIVSISSFRV